MSKEKELLFSVTKDDFEWTFTKDSGPGGQKRNKTSSACYCSHKASGAQTYCAEYREQSKNREGAFLKMCNDAKFKKWHRIQVLKYTGKLKELEDEYNKLMHPKNFKVEVKQDGKWIEVKENELND